MNNLVGTDRDYPFPYEKEAYTRKYYSKLISILFLISVLLTNPFIPENLLLIWLSRCINSFQYYIHFLQDWIAEYLLVAITIFIFNIDVYFTYDKYWNEISPRCSI